MKIPTEADVAAALRKLQPSEKREFLAAMKYVHWQLWMRRGKRTPGISPQTLGIVCAKAAAVWEQVHS